jgi:predicted RNase H-related nuclease YkuK (DUF458 family)
VKDNWYNGSGKSVKFADVLADIKTHSRKEGTIFIGTDNQVIKKECIFSTAICLHGAKEQTGGRYYFRKLRFKRSEYPTLLIRITSEVQNSVQIAMKMLEFCPLVDIEIHLDISPSNKQEKTSKFADMLVGYAKGTGFECKTKPNAFAATTVADKHTK